MKGLTSDEAASRLKKDGFNELSSSRSRSVYKVALDVIKEPMFVLLIGSGLLYAMLGEFREGITLASTFLIIIYITFYQSNKTEKALDALKKLSSPRALVIRDGKQLRIAGREVVMEDVVILKEGDRVPADGVLHDAVHLHVDESLLTGESLPVMKHADIEGNTTFVYSGTLVISGYGKYKVTATGINTEFGKIGTSLKKIEKDQTRLQKEMKVLIRRLFIIGILISASVVVLFYLTRGNFIQSLLNGISVSMAILPEEFPVVLTVFLALGAWRLSKVNVLTRNPTAIETLGSATVLCSDKTGTITQNKMEVVAAYNGKEILKTKDQLVNGNAVQDIIWHAYRSCSSQIVDPMESAIEQLFKGRSAKESGTLKFMKEYPFNKEMMAISRVYESDRSDKWIVASKGAPETMFELCHLSEEQKKGYESILNEFALKGYRVIAVAKSEIDKNKLPEKQNGLDLVMQGLLAFEDPIRPEVPNAVKECMQAGVKVIMITGDFPVTARSIGNQIGLPEDGKIVTGEALEQLNDRQLCDVIEQVSIFARVKPEQKLRIVEALKANNEVVAMTGDGVNDAPALKAADIGISMGKKGTDVAREASSLVLLDDDFASIISAIRSGRRIFDNLQKAMSYIMSIHIPIIGLALIPAFFADFPIFLLPLHIVFMELIIDPVCSVVFESEGEEKDIMLRKPRPTNESFFGTRKIAYSIFQGSLLLIMVLSVYFLSINEGHTEGEVRAISFSSLIIGNLFLILANLSKSRSFISVLLEKNITIRIMFPSVIVMLFLILTVPALQTTFSFQFPGFIHFIPSLIGAVSMLVILETIKLIRYRRSVKV